MQSMSCSRILSSSNLSSCENSNFRNLANFSSLLKCSKEDKSWFCSRAHFLSNFSSLSKWSKVDKSCLFSRAHFLSRSLSWESESSSSFMHSMS
ncbi:hypothetical protein Fmac_031308 [Flemingia macrophylla]|uniref:Uncharacterized protein n=1 Tax=Flemingia macrophylla TaxID=520843 RepID=A0ABD1L1P2_9FABA